VQPRANILVVEDSRTQAAALALVLEREGHRVALAGDGREALLRVRDHPPDLVFLDLVLPDMDGLEVLRALKEGAQQAFVPVILLSARADLDSRVTGLRLGADDFLAKPFAEAEVLARAAAMLRIKSLQDELRAAKAELERLSITDALTGLHNRRHFQDRLAAELHRAQRYGDPLALLMIDLDHFKRVNDTWGHPAGDAVLRGTAELVRSSVRDLDTCARFGGEEFAIVLPNTPLGGALVVAERVWRNLGSQRHAVGTPEAPQEVAVSASIGVAFYPAQATGDADTLVKRADEALYCAKREGRNAICVFDGRAYRHTIRIP
jgi:diguanylate cyclase (GGDEF)-like protein